MKTYTEVIEGNDIYDLFQKVYSLASGAMISVYVDACNLKATITYKLSEYNPEAE